MSRPSSTRTVLFCSGPPRGGPGPLTELAGRSLIGHVLRAAGVGATQLTVVGADDEVIGHLERTPGLKAPDRRAGTIAEALADDADAMITVIVRSDTPLLTSSIMTRLVEPVRAGGYAAACLGPAWAFRGAELAKALDEGVRDSADLDEVMADVVENLQTSGHPIATVSAPENDLLQVTDQIALARARALLRDRLLRRWMAEGVTVVDPATTWIDADVVLTSGVTLLRNTELAAGTTVGAGCVIGPDTTLIGTRVGSGTRIRSSICEHVRIGPDNNVGPYSYLRGGTASGRGVIMGSHVHIKAAAIGADTSVPHFAYLGDITIGERGNISGFSGTVNFDGRRTHRTTVGDDVMIGAGTILVAPIEVGGGAYTAAGSVLTRDVPAGALALTRIRQEHIEGWVESTMPDSPAARTARRLRRDHDED